MKGVPFVSKHQNFKRQLLFFFVFSVVEYALFHLSYVLAGTINDYALFPIRLSLSVFPVTAAVAIVRDGLNFKKAALRALIISAMRFLTSFAYSYMFLIFATTMRTAEALTFAPIISIPLVLIYFLLILACYGFIRLGFVIKKADFSSSSEYFPLSATDFKNPVSLGILFFPLAIFAFEFISEIIGTVSFFIDYGTSFRIGEIIFMVASYLFILLKLVISVLLPALLANKILKEQKVED